MSTSSKNPAKSSQYSATSRKRQAMRAQATLMGWEPLDLLGAYRDGDTLIVILRDESRITAQVSQEVARSTPESSVDEVSQRRQKKVYPPKSWPADKWNKAREQLIERQESKDGAREAAKYTKDITEKMRTHLLAVIDALPDTPDWYTLLPIADES